MRKHAADNGKSGECAHDDGIPENSGHGNKSLPHGIFGGRGTGGDGGGTDTGFVGKKSPGNAEACRHKKGTAAKSAHSSFFRESRG